MVFDDDEPTQIGMMRVLRPSGLSRRQACLIMLAGPAPGTMFLLGTTAVIGRGQVADVRLDDASVSRAHCRIEREGMDFVLIDLGSRNGTQHNGKNVSRIVLAEGDKIQVGNNVLMKFGVVDEVDAEYQARILTSMQRDALTGAYNRAFFDAFLQRSLATASPLTVPMGVLLLDIDHFKRVNDTHGHLVGDIVLKECARRWTQALRRDDVLARFGGEEFVVLCPLQSVLVARQVAERLRLAVAEAPFDPGRGAPQLTITVSIGVALSSPEVSPLALLAAADAALYASKHRGRNLVTFADTLGGNESTLG